MPSRSVNSLMTSAEPAAKLLKERSTLRQWPDGGRGGVVEGEGGRQASRRAEEATGGPTSQGIASRQEYVVEDRSPLPDPRRPFSPWSTRPIRMMAASWSLSPL